MSTIAEENTKYLRKAVDTVIIVDDVTFDNDSLLSYSVQLRGVNRDLSKGTSLLEGSEIEFKAYVEGSSDTWINFVSELDEGAEITFSCGYEDDMSAERVFYLDDADYDAQTKVLTMRGCDATLFKMDVDYNGQFIESTYANVRADYYDGIKDILDECGVEYTEAGTVPSGVGSTPSNILFQKGTARSLIAEACGVYKTADFCVSYRDAGRPQLIAGESVALWELNEADLCDFAMEIERNVKEYDVTLPTYFKGSTEELISATDCVAGTVYFADMSEPIYSIGACTNCTAEMLGLYTIKYTCATSGTCTINGKKIVSSTLLSDAPRKIIEAGRNGIVVDIGEVQKLNAENGSITANAIAEQMKEPSRVYKFKWRGNPHIQPDDILRIYRYTGGRVKPSESLHPSTELVPDGDTYIDLRVQSISLDGDGGGLTSDVEARWATYYDYIGTLYPSTNLYPSNSLYPA